MFEDGKLLLFHPFLFKNGATPKDKFFVVLKELEGNILLASLPTSKDHVHGNLDIANPFYNIHTTKEQERLPQNKLRQPH